jgi:hypothetical protein
MSSIICNRNGVIEVSLGSTNRRDGAGPKENSLNSNAARRVTRPYGEAVQSNVLYGTLWQNTGAEGMAIKFDESVDAGAVGNGPSGYPMSRRLKPIRALAIVAPTEVKAGAQAQKDGRPHGRPAHDGLEDAGNPKPRSQTVEQIRHRHTTQNRAHLRPTIARYVERH